MQYIAALLLTLMVESPIYVALLGSAAGCSWRGSLPAAIGVNIVSHPLFTWAALPFAVAHLPETAAVCLCESAVCALEAALIRSWLGAPVAAAAGASLVANAASLGVGLIVFSIAG